MTTPLTEAINCCKTNNDAVLATLVPSQIDPNAIVPQFRYKSIIRNDVPLLCIAAAYDAIPCANILLQAGADVEKADSIIFLN